MTIRHMIIFRTVCENGYNSTKAAEVLHMTQPAVSLAIKELEQYYGVHLFDRIGRRLQITDAGQHFLQYAIHISDLFSDMETRLRDWDSKGVLRIGASITIGSQFLPNYVKAFSELCPELDVRVTVEQSERLEQKILANELDKLRCERLKYNVQSQGAEIVDVINGRGEKIGDLYPEQFDKVLLDTPCSGEGRFTIYNVQSYKTWSPKTVNDLTKMQRKLFKSAFNALKSNGTLVYSTCTLNKQENEEILQWALDNFNVKLLPINIEIKEALHAFNEGMSKDLNKAIRILPSKNMEGFFVSKFIKG